MYIYIYNTLIRNILFLQYIHIYIYVYRYYIHSRNAGFQKEYKRLASANAGNLINTMVTANKKKLYKK